MSMKFIKAYDGYTDKDNHVPAPYIRRCFEIDFNFTRAVLRICTAGFYDLYMNGVRITKGYIAPYISNPEHFVCYDEYDVTDILKNGKNAIGIILGNGFANQSVYHWGFGDAAFRAPLSVAARLKVLGEGKEYTLETDEDFKWYPSPIIYDMYRYGTHYDARREIDGWSEPHFNDEKWNSVSIAKAPDGEIIPCTAEPVVLQYELKPISIRRVSDFYYLKTAYRGGENVEFSHIKDGYLYDFGESHSGVCKLSIRGRAGQKITLRHCEKLDSDGNFNINSIYTYNKDYLDFIPDFQTDVYILGDNKSKTYVPQFTYHGFRYVLVEGITVEQATEDLLTFEVFNSDVKRRGCFRSSDEVLNKLYKMGENAVLSNFHYFPTDCPHREKNGWTGDISVSSEHILLSFDAKRSFALWLRSLRESQMESGMLPAIVPTASWGYSWGNGPFWDAACVNLPYYIYKFDKDMSVLSDNAEMICKYLNYIAKRRDKNGLVAVGLGDWVQPKIKERGMMAPLKLTDSATVYDISKKAAEIFELLGLEAERQFALRLAREMRCAIRENLIDYTTMTADGSCQTSQAYLYYLGIFDEDERDRAYKRLIEIIEDDGRHLMCGMIGARFIFDVLIEGGDGELAYEMITRPDPPSYAAMIERGATALCESLEENGVQESENHHIFGDISRIFISHFAGLKINPKLTDERTVILEPCVIRQLNHAYAEYDFGDGKAFGGWTRESGKIRFFVTLPQAAKGKFIYGKFIRKLNVGYNEFII